ncbi:putative serine/threonine-protein kinase Nek3 putativeprotein kinase [Leptomonas pyrrhocoris]|uniref:non-specific serine/threonine protein kinase n=1 Tax=Leptomonas pyrrhocoris TaxID=157538 RepID=A0A0N0DVQ5_LEPPY|nr:putative serine/threonine-protein kinase Nek3 putativeprotein kinase [Leptomonas pyrrhocoris]KPA80698.1 putative serine/threonine-protein kinase Nek3 putativeprotein kinase [Leptomonas pyrrhocoris]|eukprot:XP_015659137.1 putative serine/threonine-protein kinase Nek3 putativeprotein kinase [Leptomonas pyrrhocoris]
MHADADADANRMKDYEVFEHIGSGASGDVYRVVYKPTNRTYVLKKMSLANMSDEEQLRAKQEIIVMDEVDHPNIVKFRESFSDPVDNTVDIVMEYCEFGTLEGLIERQRYEGRPFPTDVLLEWMAELLCGLAHIHSKRILHRDLKSSNIFVTSKNHLKLGDFGVCTILAFPNAKAESMIGTPLYFAPEVCNNDAYDERSDVWSLGVVFYEMCTLRRPFEGDNLFSLIQQILDSEIAPFNNGVPSELEGLVRLMLDRDPTRRPTAQELIDVHLEVPPSHPSHPSQKPSRGRLLQQFSGPELLYTKPWPSPPGTVVPGASPKTATSNSVTSEWIQTSNAVDILMELQRTTHGISNGKKEEGATEAAAATPAARTPAPAGASAFPRLSGSASKAKSVKPAKKVGSTQPPPTTSVIKHPPSRAKKAPSKSPSPRVEEDLLNGSSASITMRDLQLDIQRRRTQMFGDEANLLTDEVPVVIELPGGSFPQALDSLRSSSKVEESTVREASSFLADIAAVLDKHTTNGKHINLEHLDDAACLLSQYKFLNYGLK